MLNPDARKEGCKDCNLTAKQSAYRDAWEGEENEHTAKYNDLKQLCSRAENAQLKWNAVIPPTDLPPDWVSAHASLLGDFYYTAGYIDAILNAGHCIALERVKEDRPSRSSCAARQGCSHWTGAILQAVL